jgi:hypothetical protein
MSAHHAPNSRAKGVIEHLADQGAVVHDGNAKDVAQYLSEFAHTNEAVLPREAHIDHLGLVDDALILPSGGVGISAPVAYSGHIPLSVGQDIDAYPQMIREAATWLDAPAFWLILSLSLASPIIARLRLQRNAVIYLVGGTGIGKTTKVLFATGIWGDPTRRPFLIQGNHVTAVGLSQTLDFLCGLPLFVDEAHAFMTQRKWKGWLINLRTARGA